MKEELVLSVGDLMTENLVFAAAEDSVMEAARLMGRRKVSCVLVKRGGKYSGMLTDRDIIDRVVSKGLDVTKIKVDEVMSYPLITIGYERAIDDAAKKMRDNSIRRLVVVRNQEIAGIIAESDIIRIEPEFHFLIRERSKLEATLTRTERQQILLRGFCEECENYSCRLKNVDGSWLCEECRQ
jgi:CBS domain-containing protein